MQKETLADQTRAKTSQNSPKRLKRRPELTPNHPKFAKITQNQGKWLKRRPKLTKNNPNWANTSQNKPK